MSKIDDGGPVYPQVEDNGSFDDNNKWIHKLGPAVGGITRRNECADRIAASVASDLVMFDEEIEDSVIKWLARISYKLSDALIAEGRKGDE